MNAFCIVNLEGMWKWMLQFNEERAKCEEDRRLWQRDN